MVENTIMVLPVSHMCHHRQRHGRGLLPYPWQVRLVIALVMIGSMAIKEVYAGQLSPEAADREAKIKAAYLYQMINYVDWPSTAFASDMAPFILGIVGDSPIAGYLEAIAKTKTVKGRTLRVQRINAVDAATTCHLIFLSANADDEIENSILNTYNAKPALIVGEQSDVVTKGGVVNLAVEKNQVRLQMSLVAAKRQQLKVSSKLSVIAKIVD